MATTLTKSPSSATGGSPQPITSTSLDVITDSSDSTYVGLTGGFPSVEGAIANANPAGDVGATKLHRFRGVLRGAGGAEVEALFWSSNDPTGIDQDIALGTIGNYPTNYRYVVPDDQDAVTLSYDLTRVGFAPQIMKLTVEFDVRTQPTHTSAVKNLAGTEVETITDTRRPRIVFGGISAGTRDDLPWYGDRYHIKDDAPATVVNVRTTGSSGSRTIVGPSLPNGDYTVEMTTYSKIGNPASNTEFASETEIIAFTIDADLEPDYTPQVLDAALVSKVDGTITNTSRPRLQFENLDTHGYDVIDWEIEVENASAVVVETLSGTGTPPDTILMSPTVNGVYTATFTMNTGDPDGGGEVEETLVDAADFTLDFTQADANAEAPLIISEIKLHISALPRRRGEFSP